MASPLWPNRLYGEENGAAEKGWKALEGVFGLEISSLQEGPCLFISCYFQDLASTCYIVGIQYIFIKYRIDD